MSFRRLLSNKDLGTSPPFCQLLCQGGGDLAGTRTLCRVSSRLILVVVLQQVWLGELAPIDWTAPRIAFEQFEPGFQLPHLLLHQFQLCGGVVPRLRPRDLGVVELPL